MVRIEWREFHQTGEVFRWTCENHCTSRSGEGDLTREVRLGTTAARLIGQLGGRAVRGRRRAPLRCRRPGARHRDRGPNAQLLRGGRSAVRSDRALADSGYRPVHRDELLRERVRAEYRVGDGEVRVR